MFKKTHIFIILLTVLALCSMVFDTNSIGNITIVNADDNQPVQYIDSDGTTKYCSSYTIISNENDLSNLPAGWYVVKGNTVITKQITFANGTSNIILTDGSNFTSTLNGQVNLICFQNTSLNIYAQSTNTGIMGTATFKSGDNISSPQNAISMYGGDLTIIGGKIYAYGGSPYTDSYGLGYASCSAINLYGSLILNGGHLYAYAGKGSDCDIARRDPLLDLSYYDYGGNGNYAIYGDNYSIVIKEGSSLLAIGGKCGSGTNGAKEQLDAICSSRLSSFTIESSLIVSTGDDDTNLTTFANDGTDIKSKISGIKYFQVKSKIVNNNGNNNAKKTSAVAIIFIILGILIILFIGLFIAWKLEYEKATKENKIEKRILKFADVVYLPINKLIFETLLKKTTK